MTEPKAANINKFRSRLYAEGLIEIDEAMAIVDASGHPAEPAADGTDDKPFVR